MPDPQRTAWLAPLLATLAIQTATAMLSRLVPTIAPVLMANLNWSDTAIGHLAAINTLGSMLFLIGGAPLIRRAGPIRSMQIGLVFGAVGVALLALPLPVAAVMACLLIGFGYGPAPSAGSEILQRHAPPGYRNLIFSVKQAGVPVGGAIAGLVLPFLVEQLGWRSALAFGVLAALATIAAVEVTRTRIDADRDRGQRLDLATFLAWENLLRPLRAIVANPVLPKLVFAGACFAIAQGIWIAFLVTACVTEFGMSLIAAGAVFAAMQLTGIVGRVLLGWCSDRLGSGQKVLRCAAFASAATSLALAFATPEWPYWGLMLLAAIAGVTVSSWNGVQLAEIARVAPRRLVAETAAGATILVFIGYVVGPAGVAVLIAATGRFDAGFLVAALAGALAFVALRMAARANRTRPQLDA